jgi:transposase
LQREHELSGERQEKQVLSHIIQDKQKELTRIVRKQKQLEATLANLLKTYGRNLTTIPGIGIILAAKIVTHTQGIERFPTISKFLQYAGIAPLEKGSGQKKKAVQNNKVNRLLNNTMYLVALSQLRHNPQAKKYYQKKLAEGKTKNMRCAV